MKKCCFFAKALPGVSSIVLALVSQTAFGSMIPAGQTPTANPIPWQGITGVEGGIPSVTTIYQTLSPGATVSQINTALANCPSNQVVFLNAGTYNLSGQVLLNGKSGVVLRGAGPTNTILIFASQS